mgnify:CR=1 FL=1
MKILIHRKTGKKFLVKENKDLNTHLGIIKWEDVKNAKNGDVIKSHLNEEFIILENSFIDEIKFIERKTQTVHEKDFGLLVSLTGISSGWRVVEGGTGSGFLTILLANIVKPNGKVYSYEIREDFYKISKKNIEKLGLNEYVELKLKNINNGIDEKDVDLIVLDIPDPWNTLEHAYNSLKPGGFLVIFLPNITSVLKLLEKNNSFKLIGIYESIVRKWKYDKDVLRPINKQLVHTEFLILMRKF